MGLYSDQERDRIRQQSADAIRRVDATLAESQRERDLAWAMAQPVESKTERWRREAEEAEQRKEAARQELAAREQAAFDWWGAIDRRIAGAVEEHHRRLCGPADEAAAATCTLEEAGILVQMVVDLRREWNKQLEAALKSLREEIANLAAPPPSPSPSPKEMARRIGMLADQMA